ncbi:hypothetical protein BH10BAC2_BH10BAC2_05220 [soil metagenome]
MYAKSNRFELPSDENLKIWKYMDLSKLVSILSRRQLYFTRPDQFEDSWEGSYPKANMEEFASDQEVPLSTHREINKYMRAAIGVNCWHMNENESAAMWKLYLKSDEGIAIQSTLGRLKESLVGLEIVYMGLVEYENYDEARFPRGDRYIPFFRKRKSFAHEQELRAVFRLTSPSRPLTVNEAANHFPKGMYHDVDTAVLIENIYTSPTMQSWCFESIKAVVKALDDKWEIKKSKLTDEALF